MNRIKDYKKLAEDITNWIKQYAIDNNIKSLVVGVSGGIDSAVVSTLCAMSGLDTWVVTLAINSHGDHLKLAHSHAYWLRDNHKAIGLVHRDISNIQQDICFSMTSDIGMSNQHVNANTKSRLRMLYLYHIAGYLNGIVVGTGNKVEDFGVGFYTKYGDGGVDISPIADLYKTEVRELAKHLGISEEIINAAPTDGLWADGRTDEQQIGATYEELEWAMETMSQPGFLIKKNYTQREHKVFDIYYKLHKQNQHKMNPIPIFKLNEVNG